MSDVCYSKSWPPQDLAHYLRLTRNSLTSYQRCEDAEVTYDVSSIEVLNLLQSTGRRDSTLSVLALSTPGRFKVPNWCKRSSLLSSAASKLCSHEVSGGQDDVVFQLCQKLALTQSHCDAGGNGALLSLFLGES